ncbi:MAG: hypothetical protein F4Y34_08260 [Gammaproteobacteria bacterium]|nr:hypothetical protein [Gammaproteobacteria bacterium]
MSHLPDGCAVRRESRPGRFVKLLRTGPDREVVVESAGRFNIRLFEPTVADREADDWEIVA